MNDTLPELADELDAIARRMRGRDILKADALAKIERIADKLRARAAQPHAVLGQPDEPQLPYVTGPFGEMLDD